MRGKILLSCLTAVVVGAAGAVSGATTYYVDDDAPGNNTGTNWYDACTTLTGALAKVGGDDEVWVAEGTYYPGTARTDSFELVDGVPVYGGFTNGMAWGDRDWATHDTVLSGDVGILGVNTDNCYQVVLSAANAVLDGFTITNGYGVDAADPADRGAGMYNTDASMRIANCTFAGNMGYEGGALYNNTSVTSVIENCTFVGNVVTSSAACYGGAVFLQNHAHSTFRNCVFRDNRAMGGSGAGSGGVMYIRGASPTLDTCVFSGNSAVGPSGYGGAVSVANDIGASPTFTDCTFFENYAKSSGGAVRSDGAPTFVRCIFAANRTGDSASAIYLYSRTVTLRDCTFSGNASGNHAAIWLHTAGNLDAAGCTFCGTKSNYGGPIKVYYLASATVRNCLFAGNWISNNRAEDHDRGSGIMFREDCTGTVENCTFWGNLAADPDGAAIYSKDTCAVTNCIIWNNLPYELCATNAGTVTVDYTDVEGGIGGSGVVNGGTLADGGHNIDANPLFADVRAGQWDGGNGVYDPSSGRTILTNDSADWQSGELTGMLLNPDTNSTPLQYYIYTNENKTITVWGDASEGEDGEDYAVYDFHLKSGRGRWTALGWVRDALTSPCIDAGDPDMTVTLEPSPNGRIVNMGAYGNTAQASMTLPAGTVIEIQ